jgi:hypothetical protein
MTHTIPLELARRIHEKALEKNIRLPEIEYVYVKYKEVVLINTEYQNI